MALAKAAPGMAHEHRVVTIPMIVGQSRHLLIPGAAVLSPTRV
jgi:hypothetical protein